MILGVKELGNRWDYSVRTQIVKEGTISNLRVTSECTTGGPSSSCEMIILCNNSHGGIIRVSMGIFTTALRNKKKKKR